MKANDLFPDTEERQYVKHCIDAVKGRLTRVDGVWEAWNSYEKLFQNKSLHGG